MQVLLIFCFHMYCRWRSSYQEGRVGTSFTGLALQHLHAYCKAEPAFSTSYVVVFFIIQRVKARGECLICLMLLEFLTTIANFRWQLKIYSWRCWKQTKLMIILECKPRHVESYTDTHVFVRYCWLGQLPTNPYFIKKTWWLVTFTFYSTSQWCYTNNANALCKGTSCQLQWLWSKY
jgi:hypothetical protein